MWRRWGVTCAARDHGPNLSISVSPGREIKGDSPSSGERSGRSQARIPVVGARCQGGRGGLERPGRHGGAPVAPRRELA